MVLLCRRVCALAVRPQLLHEAVKSFSVLSSASKKYDSLPIVDLSDFVNEGPTERKLATAQALRKVCSEIGFLYVKGHGVQKDLINNMVDVSRSFFALSAAQKEMIAMSGDSQGMGRGYQLLGENVTLGKRDWHEAIDFIRQLPASHPLLTDSLRPDSPFAAARPLLSGINRVPHKPVSFEPIMDEYVREMLRVGNAIMRAMALSLDLPEHYFTRARLTNDSFWLFRVIGYPPLMHSCEGVSCGEHTDYGCLTILHQDSKNPNSLQVRNLNGEWISAEPIDGCFVINLGDTWTTWTRGFYKSTPHRVVHTGPGDRVSIPFFFEPNFDAHIKPLDEASITANDDQPASFVYGQHLLRKVETNFNFQP